MWVVIWIGVQFLFTAVTGVAGINGMTPKRFWPFWPFMLICVFLAGTAVWVAIDQQRSSDTQYRQVDGQLKDVQGQLKGVKQQLTNQDTSLKAINGQNTNLQDALTKIGTAAHIPSGVSLDDLVRGITDKLPKAMANTTNVKGNNNVTSVGQVGGQTAGTIINEHGKPPEFSVLENDPIKPDPKGGYTISAVIQVVADSVPNNMVVGVQGNGVTGLDIQALDAGIMSSGKGNQGNVFLETVTTPVGRYRIDIHTSDPNTHATTQIAFNAK